MPDMSNMTVTEAMKQIERNNNPNFIIAEPYRIQWAINEKLITEIGESKNGNVYYEINSCCTYNSVLMHVRDNKHIVINKLVNCNGQIIDLANELSRYSFCTKECGSHKSRERVIWNVDKKHNHFQIHQISIERIIVSYMEYGELRALPSYMHVHHKAQTWDNRESTTMYIHKELHKHRNRHLSGEYIDSIDRFIELLKVVDFNEKYYRGITVVE